MPFEAEERDRLIALTQGYADAAAAEIRIEDTGVGILVRGTCHDVNGRSMVETLNLTWDLVEGSTTPERFLMTQVWAVEHSLAPTGTVGRPRP